MRVADRLAVQGGGAGPNGHPPVDMPPRPAYEGRMDLTRHTFGELEALFGTAAAGPDPRGLFEGRFLCWHPAPRAAMRAIDTLLFRAQPFGVDFDRSVWWFTHPRLGVGRFSATRGESRWRPGAEVLRLVYDPSRLPMRGMLYDEVKALDDDTCLGIGGVNRGPGAGEHFFFALRRRGRANG